MRDRAPQRIVAAALAVTAAAVVTTTSAMIIGTGVAHAGGILPGLSGLGGGAPTPFQLPGLQSLGKY